MVDGLIKISGCDNANRVGDVIFVHGLGGDALETWLPVAQDNRVFRFPWKQQESSEKLDKLDSWLSWLGQERPEIGIWSLQYEAEPFKRRGFSMALTDRATNTLRVLQAERLGARPLLFITHSMGGLLVKQMIRHGWDYDNVNWKTIIENIKGIVFLSTPHTGSNLSNLVQYFNFLFPTTVSVQELQNNASQLRDLNQAYRHHSKLGEIPIEVYFETKKTSGILVVDETSADPGIQGVIPTPMDENHLSICRPASTEAPVYKLVSQFIEEQLTPRLQKGTPTLWVHGWAEQQYPGQPTAVLNWSLYFSKESYYQIPDPSLWEQKFLPELRQIRDRWCKTYSNRSIALRGKLPLTALLGIGYTFPYVGGYDLEIEQHTNGVIQTWKSQVSPSTLKFRVVKETCESGDELLIVFSVTGDSCPQVEKWMHKSSVKFGAIVYLEPETGVGNNAITSNADAVALAAHAKSLMQHYRQHFRASRIHIILYSPASFSLFLGQHLNALGKVVAYEWDKDKEKYLPAISVSV